jgi:TfoX/Sxy family transcriptional regulator of competence genes
MIYRPVRYEQMMKAAEAFDVRARRMFNGMGIYTGEKMFAFLIDSEIGLKLCPDDFKTALDLPGAEPMRPEPTAEPLKEYVRMPKDVLDDFETFMGWVERSANYAQSTSLR